MACSAAVMRIVPAGFSRRSLTAASSASISSNRGPTVSSRRSPASVGETLRVVRVSSRTPSRASSSRIVWLSADCETPSLAAALVKLRSRATAMKARRSPGCRAAFMASAHKSMRIIAASPMARCSQSWSDDNGEVPWRLSCAPKARSSTVRHSPLTSRRFAMRWLWPAAGRRHLVDRRKGRGLGGRGAP